MMASRRSKFLLSLAALAGCLLALAPSAPAKVGMLQQLKGKAGCFGRQESPAAEVKRGCSLARFPGRQMWDVAVSPDGRNVYVAGLLGGVSAFRVDRHGRPQQLRGKVGCVSGSGKSGCAAVPELARAWRISISPDGRNVYVAAADRSGHGGVVVLARNRRSGALRR